MAVLTDGGYILYDDMPGKRALWQAFAALTPLSFDEFRARFKPYKDRAMEDSSYSLYDAIAGLAAELDLGARADDIGKTWVRPTIELREGVVRALVTLRDSHIPVVVVSDSMDSRAHLERKYFDTLGLRGLLSAIVSSREVGAQKPDPRIFEAALRAIVPPPGDRRSVLFVGHDASELEGANAFGLRPIACHYEEDRAAIGFMRDDDIIPSFALVPSLLWQRLRPPSS